MIEVFKTNVTDEIQARKITERIHLEDPDCYANFDLEDCDNILRVECITEINISLILSIVNDIGFKAEILPDVFDLKF